MLTIILALALSAPLQAGPAMAAATPENAAPFLGNWTLAGDGPNGSVTFVLAVNADAGKVVAEISGEVMPKIAITDVSKTPTALFLAFNFDYQGSPVPVALTLTPADGKIAMNMDFAGGAYVVVGGATRIQPKP